MERNAATTITAPHQSNYQTFWTSCTKCKTRFEYHGIYLNKKLRCQSCKMPFMAIEVPAPNASVLRTRSISLRASRDSTSVLASSKGNAQSSSGVQSHMRRTSLPEANPVLKGQVDVPKGINADKESQVTAGSSSGSKRLSRGLAGKSGGLTEANPVLKGQVDVPKGINADKESQVTAGSSSGSKRLSRSLAGKSGGKGAVSSKTDIRNMLSGKARETIFLELAKWK